MNERATIEPGEPLAEIDGKPRVYSVLGAFFHLDFIEADDEDRLDRVNMLVRSWFGAHLRWASAPFFRGSPPFRCDDLDYISGFCRTLELPSDPRQREVAASFHFGRDGYSIGFSGGEESCLASPYNYGFWSTGSSDESRFRMASVLSLAVPDKWPFEDFAARVTAIASLLRLRWASAGFTYATSPAYPNQLEERTIYAHARRFHCYDVPQYLSSTMELFEAVRSVNWLTFLGPALVKRLLATGRQLKSDELLQLSSVGDGILIRAGHQPARGDVNRLQVPPAYIAADTLVRPVRASGNLVGSLVYFGAPWSLSDTSEWLQRFGEGGVPASPRAAESDLPF